MGSSAIRVLARRPRRLLAAFLTLPVGVWLFAAPAALGDSTTSSNWSGYAAHGAGLHFRSASARWRLPAVSCLSGSSAYSAMWVGLGGYSGPSAALEQVGTESDCAASGHAFYLAWFELVPSASETVSIAVHPGDVMAGRVSAAGHRITVVIQDLLDHSGFTKTLYAGELDTSSAEWIVEAPSDCVGSVDCRALPLANFGQAGFSFVHATMSNGRRGSAASPFWTTTAIRLLPGARRFASYYASGSSGDATPSSLTAGGTAFSVSYRSSGSLGALSARKSGRLVHGKR